MGPVGDSPQAISLDCRSLSPAHRMAACVCPSQGPGYARTRDCAREQRPVVWALNSPWASEEWAVWGEGLPASPLPDRSGWVVGDSHSVPFAALVLFP